MTTIGYSGDKPGLKDSGLFSLGNGQWKVEHSKVLPDGEYTTEQIAVARGWIPKTLLEAIPSAMLPQWIKNWVEASKDKDAVRTG